MWILSGPLFVQLQLLDPTTPEGATAKPPPKTHYLASNTRRGSECPRGRPGTSADMSGHVQDTYEQRLEVQRRPRVSTNVWRRPRVSATVSQRPRVSPHVRRCPRVSPHVCRCPTGPTRTPRVFYCPSSIQETPKCPRRPSHTGSSPPAHTTTQPKHTETEEGGPDPKN